MNIDISYMSKFIARLPTISPVVADPIVLPKSPSAPASENY